MRVSLSYSILYLLPSTFYVFDHILDEAFRNRLRHAAPQRIVRQPVKHVYPKRQNMQECKPLFGTVGIFVAVNSDHDKRYSAFSCLILKF